MTDMRKLKSIVADAFDEHPLSVDDFDMLPFISEHEDATIKMDANSVEPKKNRLTHKEESKMKLQELLESRRKDKHPEYKQALETSPQLAWRKYGREPKELKKREHLWAKSAETAYYYADHLGRRFPAGEPAISKDPLWAFYYARNVIKKRFPAGEEAIASDPQWAYEYARQVIKKRFPAGEEAIASDADRAFDYAEFLGKRFLAGEPTIAKNPDLAHDYATMFNLKYNSKTKTFLDK